MLLGAMLKLDLSHLLERKWQSNIALFNKRMYGVHVEIFFYLECRFCLKVYTLTQTCIFMHVKPLSTRSELKRYDTIYGILLK